MSGGEEERVEKKMEKKREWRGGEEGMEKKKEWRGGEEEVGEEEESTAEEERRSEGPEVQPRRDDEVFEYGGEE